MKTATIEFKVRTPLFLGGVDRIDPDEKHRCSNNRNNRNGNRDTMLFNVTTNTASLNTNSFRGVLRWWFRTLHGNRQDGRLLEAEAELFGSISKGSGFKLKILQYPSSEPQIWLDSTFSEPNCGEFKFSRGWEGKYNGLKYFTPNLYVKSKPKQNEVRGKISKREYFVPEDNFKIQIIANSSETLKKVLLLFWLSFQFSGIGVRARRGFGGLEILGVDSSVDVNCLLSNKYSDERNFETTIEENLKCIKEVFKLTRGSNQIPFLQSSTLLRSNKGWKSWKKAINAAGFVMQLFRAVSEPDYFDLRDVNSGDCCERAVFGLPIQYKFSNGVTNNVTVNHFEDKQDARFASPMLVSLTQIGALLYPQYLILDFDYNLPISAKVGKKKMIDGLCFDSSAIGPFIDHLIDPSIPDPERSRLFDINLKGFSYKEYKMGKYF